MLTLFINSFTLLRTVKKLLLLPFYLNILVAYSVSSYAFDSSQGLQTKINSSVSDLPKNFESIANFPDLQKNFVFVLSAWVTDIYTWSEQDKRYSLQSSQFNFKVELEDQKTKELKLVDSGNIIDKPNQDTRYLYVRTSNMVHFMSAVTGTKKTLKASLSDNKENLKIYLPEKDKSDILSGMISAVGMDFSIYQNQNKFSDYNCHIENKELVCIIDYVLRNQGNHETGIHPQSKIGI